MFSIKYKLTCYFNKFKIYILKKPHAKVIILINYLFDHVEFGTLLSCIFTEYVLKYRITRQPVNALNTLNTIKPTPIIGGNDNFFRSEMIICQLN